MPDLRDRKVDLVELIPPDDRLVQHEETIRTSTEDESVSEKVTIRKFPVHWCGHYKGYGYTCRVPGCGNRFCRDCLSRVTYCKECGITLGPCCSVTTSKGAYCPDHRPLVDWGGPVGQLIGAVAFLGGLALALYALYRIAG